MMQCIIASMIHLTRVCTLGNQETYSISSHLFVGTNFLGEREEFSNINIIIIIIKFNCLTFVKQKPVIFKSSLY